MRIKAFIQARMGSTRLPGKVLKTVLGRPLLDFLVERLSQSREINDIVILTSNQPEDDKIALFCQEKNLSCFRGSEDDVLDRFYQAALQTNPEGIVRITSDCPLTDPDIIDQVIREFRQEYPKIDYVSNSMERTFPRGLDVEVFSFKALEKAFQNASRPEEREHVTVYLYRHPKQFHLKNVAHFPSLAHHRWTVDTIEDFTLIRLILENLYPRNPQFRLKDVLDLLKEHADWILLNAHIKQKKL
jgi:spore coat polysaccharide biosynthesis protein SpsF